MQSNSLENITQKKVRRSAKDIRDEYKKFVDLYKSGLTPFEIMRKLSISKVQYKNYFADAITEAQITPLAHDHGTCFGKHLPLNIRVKLNAEKEDLIRFELIDDGVLLSKIEEKK